MRVTNAHESRFGLRLYRVERKKQYFSTYQTFVPTRTVSHAKSSPLKIDKYLSNVVYVFNFFFSSLLKRFEASLLLELRPSLSIMSSNEKEKCEGVIRRAPLPNKQAITNNETKRKPDEIVDIVEMTAELIVKIKRLRIKSVPLCRLVQRTLSFVIFFPFPACEQPLLHVDFVFLLSRVLSIALK